MIGLEAMPHRWSPRTTLYEVGLPETGGAAAGLTSPASLASSLGGAAAQPAKPATVISMSSVFKPLLCFFIGDVSLFMLYSVMCRVAVADPFNYSQNLAPRASDCQENSPMALENNDHLSPLFFRKSSPHGCDTDAIQAADEGDGDAPLAGERRPINAVQKIEQRIHVARTAVEDEARHVLGHFQATVARAQPHGHELVRVAQRMELIHRAPAQARREFGHGESEVPRVGGPGRDQQPARRAQPLAEREQRRLPPPLPPH